MSLSAPGRTWEEATAPGAVRLARRFESAWRDVPGRRPDPDSFLRGAGPGCPGARLALLRAELTLRWEDGDKVRVEWYRDRYGDLDDETLVALAYEEFCLREDDEEEPDPAEYYARFPALTERLRRVLDIHGLVGGGAGTGQTTVLSGPKAPAVPFPETGQTIAGFHLVEELGRGAFARVFLARERQLADRPVALKVARAGSREPQMLARLQHTHIVPVYSTRTDPATGLHLLCMPYFGRVTLAQLLADRAVRVARSGADLVAALDRLGPADGPPSGRSAGRLALGPRPYAEAIAWWGARMAEALEHAHDRGVLHRDIKPSNVLVTADGMPMLLDFNLARESVLDPAESAPGMLGGTLDYMAPEHLEALADGGSDRVDGRSDLYGLGVLLYEAVMGGRPFATPRDAASAAEVLVLAAEERREGAPWLRTTHPEVPSAYEAVVRRCLAPDPADRYASAAELAADLQAVADDRPLKFAREPWSGRAGRWGRRHGRGLVMAAPALLALLVAAVLLGKARGVRTQLGSEAQQFFEGGVQSLRDGDTRRALIQFDAASRLAQGRPRLDLLHRRAREQLALARQTGALRDEADALSRAAESLRFRLTGFGAPETAARQFVEILAPFYVLTNAGDWTKRPDLTLLDEARRARLGDEVNLLLFLHAVALERSGGAGPTRRARFLCDRALLFAEPKGPWRVLRARLGGPIDATDPADDPTAEPSALGCFEWGWLRDREGRRDRAIAWLDRAAWLEPDNAWYQTCLADLEAGAGRFDDALRHYDVAIALRPRSPWARLGRARLVRRRGGDPTADLRTALDDCAALPEVAREPAFEEQLRRDVEGPR